MNEHQDDDKLDIIDTQTCTCGYPLDECGSCTDGMCEED
jgi:hypothetical protein